VFSTPRASSTYGQPKKSSFVERAASREIASSSAFAARARAASDR